MAVVGPFLSFLESALYPGWLSRLAARIEARSKRKRVLHMIDCVCPLLEDYIGTPNYTRQYSPEKTAMLADYLEELTELGLVSNDTEAPWQDAQRLRTLRHYVHDYGLKKARQKAQELYGGD